MRPSLLPKNMLFGSGTFGGGHVGECLSFGVVYFDLGDGEGVLD